jgi:hypothetical protein
VDPPPGQEASLMRRRARILLGAALVSTTVLVPTAAMAVWPGSATGPGRARAQVVSQGNQPLVVATGSSVTVSWSASTLVPSGQPVTGYVIRRYDTGGTVQPIGATCSGIVAGLTCTEGSVPNGAWLYAVTPAIGSWRGQESARASVTVAVPTVTSVNPSSQRQGFTGTVVFTGTSFVSGAAVSFSGTGITVNSTTFNSATQLTANITIASSAPLGARNVTVTNPGTLGSATCANCFTVGSTPTITTLTPAFGFRSTNVAVVVTGTNFVSGAAVTFSGTGITVNSTTFNSATQLTANITIGAAAAFGVRNVTVTNPDAGSAGCTGCFTVAAGPTVTAATPSSRGQGATSQNIVVTGNFFLNGAAVSFSGTGITVNSTTFNSATQLTANITVGTTATLGARNVIVTNPAGGGTAGTCTNCFTVNARPGTFTLNPNTRGQGAVNQIVVITGTLFQNGATVAFSGTGITVNSVTFTSATQLTANISIAANAATGSRTVTVTNPDAGNRTGTFTVAAGPVPTAANPSSRAQGTTGNVVITGTGFVSGATVAFSGTGVNVTGVTFNGATQLTAAVTIVAGAPAGARDVTVTNPNAGRGTCTGCFTVTP